MRAIARRSDAQASLLAAAVALLWLIVGIRTPDLAAQSYRVGLFQREGFALWDNNWYAGHHLPGYSLLFPPLGAVLGMRLVGVLAAVLAAFCFARLAELHFGPRARIGILWFALATVADLAIGRLTYALAAAIGLAALYAAARHHHRLAVGLAALCGAAAPLAGLFVGMAAVAVLLGRRTQAGSVRTALCLGIPAVGTGLLLTVAFNEGGREPFGTRAMLVAVGLTIGFLVITPRREHVLRAGAGLYLLGTLASFLLATPIGDNTTRLGADFAGPLLACALLDRRGRPSSFVALTGALLVALFTWQWYAPVRELAKGVGDPVSEISTYRGLFAYLGAHDTPPERLEVTFTRSHWEAAIIAPRYPLARGWEKQLDAGDDGLFYRPSLPSATYHAWLEQLGVRYVIVAHAPLDPSSRLEAKLVLGGVPYLHQVYADPHWRVFEVVHPAPLASPPATMTALGGQSFSLNFARPGTSLVRIRFSPYWRASAACVGPGAGGFTQVSATRPGPVDVTISFSFARVIEHGIRCA